MANGLDMSQKQNEIPIFSSQTLSKSVVLNQATEPPSSLRVQHNETSASVSYVRGNASVSFSVNVQAQLFAGAVPRWVRDAKSADLVIKFMKNELKSNFMSQDSGACLALYPSFLQLGRNSIEKLKSKLTFQLSF